MYHKAKFVFLGDTKVGKTCIIVRYRDNNFDYNTITTVGHMSFDSTITSGQNVVELSINDTAGQERFRAMTSIHFRDAQIIALVYDCTNEDTINSLKIWLEDIDQKSKVKHVIILVGNKADLLDDDENNWEIDEEVQELMKTYDLPHLFTSAKNNVNIKEIFQQSVDVALKRNIFSAEDTPKGTSLDEAQNKKEPKGGCC